MNRIWHAWPGCVGSAFFIVPDFPIIIYLVQTRIIESKRIYNIRDFLYTHTYSIGV